MVRRGDVLLALGVALFSWVLVLLSERILPMTFHDSSWLRAVGLLLALEGLALIWWRSHPLLTQAIVFLLHNPILLLSPADLPPSGMAQLLVSFSLGRRLSLPRATALQTSLAILMILVTVVVKQPGWSNIITLMIVIVLHFLVPMLAGAMLASRQQHEQALRRLEAKEQEQRVATALVEERRRLAGELHDVAAHHLAGLVVQAAALERLIDQDPDLAKDAARQLRGMGKEALTGLRSVVKLLRHDDPQRGLRDIGELIATTRALGVPITLAHDLAPELPPLADAAAYRIAQQAISNAIQHAPGAPIHVEVDAVGLRVSNGPGQGESPVGSGGVGLEVMRERAAAVGAAFDAGPSRTGGWRVRLDWPHVDEVDEEES
ncbi:MAG: histidine kinase [Propionibacteriaceae bacterium]|nr:histidine kinase [Propionibacteriaceae bacterium]